MGRRGRGWGSGKWAETGKGQTAAAVFGVSELFPSNSSQFISSCFQAMKFFPGKIRGPPAPPGVCHVYGGRDVQTDRRRGSLEGDRRWSPCAPRGISQSSQPC